MRILKIAGTTLAASIVIGIALLIATSQLVKESGPLAEAKTVVIPHGVNARGIGILLTNNGVVASPILFQAAAYIYAHNGLRAGEYEFPSGTSPYEAVQIIRSGKTVAHWFTVPEGLTSAEILADLALETALTGDAPANVQEGSLMPDTYRYSYGDKKTVLLERMHSLAQKTLNELWEMRAPNIPLRSKEDAIILASVVEKETGRADERPRIAGVFYNRLRLPMRLQSDPTVVYAIEHHDGKPLGRTLTHDDLAFASSINTYASDGLPSQPICNPGRAALEAVLHPEQHDFLYFVADGNGGHRFARSLDEHNRNINAYHKILPLQKPINTR